VELEESAYKMALENLALNPQASLHIMGGDVRQIRDLLPAGSFDCVISNPPYFPVGSGKIANAYRSEVTLTLKELCQAAAWLLPSGGTFALVHRPERLCDIFWELRSHGIEPKRIQFVRHKAESPLSLVLVEGRRGGKPGLTYLPDLVQFHSDGSETEAYRAAYHRGENL
jgi:tRNA1(Val) A37 N6-methylase TrmN6